MKLAADESPELSVLIVNWNVRDEVMECIESLLIERSDVTGEIIVVDNASSDKSVATIRANFPAVRVLANTENLGFARACNQAIAVSRGRHVLLLNPDTLVQCRALERLVTCADSDSGIGVVGPKLQSADSRLQYTCARDFPSVAGWFFHDAFLTALFPSSQFFGRWRLEHWDHLDERDVPCLSGACLLIPRTKLDTIGWLDESLPMYFEDIGFCYRVATRGFRVHYLPRAVVVHAGARSTDQRLVDTRVLSLAAIERFLTLRHGTPTRLLFRGAVILASLMRATVALGSLMLRLVQRRSDRLWLTRVGLELEQDRHSLQWGLGLARAQTS